MKCPYADKCINKDKLCGSCEHNEEQNYYEPRTSIDPSPYIVYAYPYSYPETAYPSPYTISHIG